MKKSGSATWLRTVKKIAATLRFVGKYLMTRGLLKKHAEKTLRWELLLVYQKLMNLELANGNRSKVAKSSILVRLGEGVAEFASSSSPLQTLALN